MPTTRRSTRERDLLDLHLMPFQPAVQLLNAEDVERFHHNAQSNFEYGLYVERFEVRLGTGFSARFLRQALHILPNLVELRLMLPASTPSTVFSGVHFPELELFVSSLPHRTLEGFLASHATTLTCLSLDRCGKSGACPLRSISFAGGRLEELACTYQCIDVFTVDASDRSPVVLSYLRLKAYAVTASRSLHATLRRLSQQNSLRFLVLDIYPEDVTTLLDISRIAPDVHALMVYEKARSSAGEARLEERPASRWIRHVKAFKKLHNVEIRSANFLVCIPGDVEQERMLLRKLLSGSTTPRSQMRFHVNLRQVKFTYCAVKSTWTRVESEWQRTAFLQG